MDAWIKGKTRCTSGIAQNQESIPMDWDSNANWKRQIERVLNRLGSMVTGNQRFQADRIADVIEQIDELRQELKRVADRQDKIAEFIRANIPKKEGE